MVVGSGRWAAGGGALDFTPYFRTRALLIYSQVLGAAIELEDRGDAPSTCHDVTKGDILNWKGLVGLRQHQRPWDEAPTTATAA